MTFVQSLKFIFFNLMALLIATILTFVSALFALLAAVVTVVVESVWCWTFAWNNFKYDPRCDHE
jgi:phage-related protein